MRMSQLPKTIYTRSDWQIPSGPMAEKCGGYKPETAEHVWIPKSKIKLRDAVAFLGDKQIDCWDGSERQARRFDNPPERPWLHLGTEDPSGQCLIFGDDGIHRFVDEESAEAWWSKIAAVLFAEWKAEQDAAERWELAVGEFRSLLAERILHAELLPESGRMIHVDPDEWLSWKAKSYFRTGVGEITRSSEFHVAKFKGIFLIDRTRLEEYFSPHTKKSQAQSVDVEIDPAIFPYLAFMLRAARDIPFEPSRRTLKKIIEGWLRDNWSDDLGEPTDSKIRAMATFLRRPQDEAGGIARSMPRKASDV